MRVELDVVDFEEHVTAILRWRSFAPTQHRRPRPVGLIDQIATTSTILSRPESG
jgi:hypothetical protein